MPDSDFPRHTTPHTPLRQVIAHGLPRAEQEILLSRCGDEDAWIITTSHPPTARRLARIAESYGLEGVLLNKYTIRFQLPLSAVSFRRSRGLTALAEEDGAEEEGGGVRHRS